MRIEEGKFYRTRDGRRALVIGRGSSPTTTRLSIDGSETICFTATGRGGYPGGSDHGTDLVALWTDEPAGPVREVTVTRKEIVGGYFGGVAITPKDADQVGIRISSLHGPGGPEIWMDASELRAAAAVFIQLAEALEDGQ